MSGEQEDKGFWDNIISNLCAVKHGCCCCCELRTGTLVIGWTYVILPVLAVISWLKEGAPNVDVLRKTPLAGNTATHEPHFGDRITPAIYCFFTIMEALASIGLLFGVYRQRSEPVKIWIVVFLISFFAGTVWEIFKYGTQMVLGEISFLFCCGIVLALLTLKPFQFWKILVVRSYYVQGIES